MLFVYDYCILVLSEGKDPESFPYPHSQRERKEKKIEKFLFRKLFSPFPPSLLPCFQPKLFRQFPSPYRNAGGARLTSSGFYAFHIELILSLPVVIGHGGASHLDVIAAEDEEHRVAAQAEQVEEDDELDGALGPQLEPLQDVPAEEDADARAGDGDAAREHGGHALGEVELGLEVLGQEDDEAGDDDELHAGAEAGDDVDLVGEELPGGARDVLYVFAVRVGGVVAGGGRGSGSGAAGSGCGSCRRVFRLLVLGPDGGVCGVVILLVDVDLHFLFLQSNKDRTVF